MIFIVILQFVLTCKINIKLLTNLGITMPLNAIKHPLIAHKIALLRQQGISTKQFRELANEVASLLTYEATRDLPMENREINGWQGEPINTRNVNW